MLLNCRPIDPQAIGEVAEALILNKCFHKMPQLKVIVAQEFKKLIHLLWHKIPQ